MPAHVEHPCGLPPPEEWKQPGGGLRTSAAEYQAYMKQTTPKAPQKKSKFGAKRGHREDLGHWLESKLEANVERFLRFTGYMPWSEQTPPPADGKWYVYERQKIRLVTKAGTAEERPLFYLPDFWIWEDGQERLIEAKGYMDPRSKRLLRLMEEQHPELPVTVITEPELERLAMAAIRESRRRGGPGAIECWE